MSKFKNLSIEEFNKIKLAEKHGLVYDGRYKGKLIFIGLDKNRKSFEKELKENEAL